MISAIVLLVEDPKSWYTSGSSILCAFPFFLAGLAIIAAGVLPWIAGLRIGKPDVSISSNSVRVGDAFSVSYSQYFGKDSGQSFFGIISRGYIFPCTGYFRFGESPFIEFSSRRLPWISGPTRS